MSIGEPVPGFQHRAPGSGFSPWHQAVDIPAPGGTPVRAVGAGIVASAGDDALSPYNLDLSESGGGKLVTIRHRLVDPGALGLGTIAAESQYAHLSAINPAVRKGAVVPAGFIIGYVGATGNATGNHLHFGFRVGGIWRDYREFLPGGPRQGARLDAEGALTAPRGYPAGTPLGELVSGTIVSDAAADVVGNAVAAAGDIARNFGLFLLFAVILILGLWALARAS